MTAEQRLKAIAQVIRDRGFYAMSPTDGAALEALILQATGRPPEPYRPRSMPPPPAPTPPLRAHPAREELADIISALSKAGWRLSRAHKPRCEARVADELGAD